MTPSDPNHPARRQRRFSALKPAIRAARPTDTPIQAESHAPGENALGVVVPDPAAAPIRRSKVATASAAPPAKPDDVARIAKVMARAGLCSRRDAEAWITAGRVAVNGEVLTSPARDVGPGDAVMVDGYPIDKPEKTRLFLFNKARGLVTTSRDPEGRPTVFDALPKDLPRLMTVGRLDINTEGLLLLTNDGGLARLLELPSTGWIRRYRVRAHGEIDQARLDALAKGITIDGVTYAGIAAKLDRLQGANAWLTMGLKEGKNREIKRVLEHLGLGVTRLIRISFGPFQLGELSDNAVEEVRTRVLRDQLGSALAKQAGVDFEGPLDQERTDVPKAPASEPSPRRQTRRTSTADRRGRAVTVERITTVDPAPRARSPGAPGRGPRAEEARSPRPRRAEDGRQARTPEDRPPRRPERNQTRAGSGPARPGREGRAATGRGAAEEAPFRSRRPDDRPKPRTDREGAGRGSRSAPAAVPANRADRRRAASAATAPKSEGPPRRSRPEREGRPSRPPGSGSGREGPGSPDSRGGREGPGGGGGRGGRGGKSRPRG